MPRLFLSGIALSSANAFFANEQPLHVAAAHALENAADVGSGIVSAAADAAAAAAGMGAHIAGKTAAEAGALAAAASGMSAASTLVGDIVGGQLAFGADVVNALIARPLQHLGTLAALAAVGGSAGAAGFAAGGALNNAIGHHLKNLPTAIHHTLTTAAQSYLAQGIAGIQSLRMGCTCILGALFGLKPATMSDLDFYSTVNSVIGDFYDPEQNLYANVAPSDVLNRLGDVLALRWPIDISKLASVSQELSLAATSFPLIGTSSFLPALHEICKLTLDNMADTADSVLPLAYSRPVSWGLPVSTSASLDGDWLDSANYNHHNWNLMEGTIPKMVTNSVRKTLGLNAPERVAVETATVVETEETNSVADQETDDDEAQQAMRDVFPYPVGVELRELPTSVGCVIIPGFGTYDVHASPIGELSVTMPEYGVLPIETHRTGETMIIIPRIGNVQVSLFTTIAIVNVSGFGDTVLRISREGQLTVFLRGPGTIPVHSTATAPFLEITIPGGTRDVTLYAPARTLVRVPGFGIAPLTISSAGAMSVAIWGVGSLPVTAQVDGSLVTTIPGVGLVYIRGISILEGPLPIDYIWIPGFGYFPVTNSNSVPESVSINGLGQFSVTVAPSGEYQVNIPRYGAFGVMSVIYSEDNQSGEAVAVKAVSRRAFVTKGIAKEPREMENLQTQPVQPTSYESRWIWSLSDAAVYFLQKLDVFRPVTMTPENFLYTVNQAIDSLDPRNFKSPLEFIHELVGLLGVNDMTPLTIETIGEHVKHAMEGPFPPFERILEHIGSVISDKLLL